MFTQNFRGREREKGILERAFDRKAKAILVYGPRRVGKSALISDVLASRKDALTINYECVVGSIDANIRIFARQAAKALNISYIARITDIFELFDALRREAAGRKIIIAFDEYPYMRESEGKGVADSYFQKIIDEMDSDITLILCGSYITVMEDIMDAGSPLSGRFDTILRIAPFSYREASLFYPSLSIRDKIAFYSVFGGYPYVLDMVDENKSLEENISGILLSGESKALNTLETTIIGQVGRTGLPKEILSAIGNGKLRYTEIQSLLPSDANGMLDRNLKKLIEMEILEKKSPINRKNDRHKSFYEISDNFMRFYFTFVSDWKSVIERLGPIGFIKTRREQLETFISLRFEKIAKEYLSMAAGAEVKAIGSYWYDDPSNRANGEFDIAEQLADSTYRIYEAKHLKNPMTEKLRDEELQKIRNIVGLNVSSAGFISSSGFAFPTDGRSEIYITGEDLYGTS